MRIVSDPKQMQKISMDLRNERKIVGFVPTMGFLHQGHKSLMDHAREHADVVVVSLFVNPAQFGPNEDLDRYPRDLERDREVAASAGVDILFTPDPAAMYAPDASTFVTVEGVSAGLCGASRPTHFRGVATVVTKLFMLVNPTFAVFGEKDRQQLAVISRMVRDLNIPVAVVGRPIVREADGLALSSRNVFLSRDERDQAPWINKALEAGAALAASGIRDVKTILAAARDILAAYAPLGAVDYLEAVDPDSMQPVETVAGPVVLAAAVQFSRARLIDNRLALPPHES
ncbi:pantoate--beta-alanine ligase [Desulfolutivibrio sp.]|uniref:pantoate--beta-alanine ligase n=1 Tax=Desulfolutivibrio sp. TaxID=2773296 RepID=UPI002F963981